MNLDRMTIAVRRRTMPEIYDLALLVLRRHLWRIVLVAVIGTGPWIVLDWWLLHGAKGGSWTWYWLLLLAAVQAPLATAPVTAFLGEAMFDEHPAVRSALRTAFAAWWPLALIGVWYGMLALFPLLLVMAPPHAVAVLTLERLRGRAALSRAYALHHAYSGSWVLHLILAALLIPATLWLGIGTFEAFGQVLGSAKVMLDPGEMAPDFNPTASVLPAVAVFVTMVYLAVVHFLAYLDLRTEREGWDIDLGLRRAAARLERAG